MKKRLIMIDDELAVVVDKKLLKKLRITKQTDLEIAAVGDSLIITRAKKETKKNKEKDFKELAKEIIKEYEPVFKKLAKT